MKVRREILHPVGLVLRNPTNGGHPTYMMKFRAGRLPLVHKAGQEPSRQESINKRADVGSGVQKGSWDHHTLVQWWQDDIVPTLAGCGLQEEADAVQKAARVVGAAKLPATPADVQ